MAISNTYEFGTNTQIDDLIRESFERIGIIGNEFTGLQIQSAIMSANLELTKWTGKVPLSWTRKRFMFSLYDGQPIYQLPITITKMIDVVAVQPQFLLGGSSFSSAGGTPGNCFDYSSTTGCTQVSPDGYISYNYGPTNSYSIQYVGVVPLSQSTYKLVVEYSFDNVNWFTIYRAPSQTYFANQTAWFVIDNSLNAKVWRIRETGGATLAIQYIYFGQPTNIGTGDRYLTSISYTEWMQIATKMNVGYPSSFFFNAQIQPTLTLWPVPGNSPANGGFTNILYTAYQYIADVTALFNQFDVPQRFYDALVAGLSFRLATKFKPERAQEMKQLSVEAFQTAVLTDYENVTLRLQPDFTSYGRV